MVLAGFRELQERSREFQGESGESHDRSRGITGAFHKFSGLFQGVQVGFRGFQKVLGAFQQVPCAFQGFFNKFRVF